MTRRERQRRRRKHKHPTLRAVMLSGGLLAGLLVLALGGFALWVVHTADSAPNLSNLAPRLPGQNTEIFAAGGQPLGYVSSAVLRTVLTQQQEPKLLREATVAIEDRRFFQHGGVDYEGLLRAAIKDVFEGGGLQGGSTLAMQLATNVYLPPTVAATHNLRYKIIQIKLANELEAQHSKNWVLTQYLNDVPYGTTYGQTAIGVAAGSQMFFDKPVNRLDLAQIALLAGLPQAPSEYNPFVNKPLARWRRGLVLAAMVRSGYISHAQAAAANAAPLQVHQNQRYDSIRQPYVVQYVEQQLLQDLGARVVDAGGLKVYTTINLADQTAAAAAIKANEGRPGDPAAALVAVDAATGQIVALQNSTTYGVGHGQTQFDYATQAARQTGSAFKAFVLMTLIKNYDGDPSQTYYDSHFLRAGWLPGYPTYSVRTAEYSYLGVINVTRATAVSDNTVYAQLGVDLGMNNVDETAHQMGITAKLTGNPAEAIGGLKYGVSPLQMADAYATLANGGEHVPPTIIAKVVLPDGRVIDLGNPPQTRVFTPGQAYEGTQTLQTVIQWGTGTSANYGCPAAGKTGTTSNYTDAWFVGYSPKISTAVWVGYPNSDVYMNDVNGLGPGYGGTLAAPIWRQFMKQASAGYCGSFPAPSKPWHGVEYFGKHAVDTYIPPRTTTTATTATTTATTSPAPSTLTGGSSGLTSPSPGTGNQAPGVTTPAVTPPAGGNTITPGQGN
ncbi:MAG: transglycosylase domain-containing protein [Solirubrobacteraceae bacterium]